MCVLALDMVDYRNMQEEMVGTRGEFPQRVPKLVELVTFGKPILRSLISLNVIH